MRIGFDGKRAFHNFRGLGNYSRNLIEGLVHYFKNNEYILYSPSIKDERGLVWRKKFHELTVRTPESFLGKKFPSAWRSLLLGDLLEKDQLDIYHGLSHELPPGIAKKSCKSVVTIHDLIYLRYPEFFKPIDRLVYDKKFRYSCSHADKIVAICEQTKKDIVEFFEVDESRIEVIYQCAHPRYYKEYETLKIEKVKQEHGISGNYLFYQGALVERKNAHLIVEAFSRSKYKNDFSLVLGGSGEGPYKNKILQTIKSLGLSERVHLLGYVEEKKLPLLYQGATTFIFPSFYEGFGIPIVESLFSETPVITSKGSCFPEAAGKGALYIDPSSVEELTGAIDRLISDEDLRLQLTREGRAHVEKFHRHNTSKNMISLYERLLS